MNATQAGTTLLLSALTLLALAYAWRWWAIERRRAAADTAPRRPGAPDLLTGFIANFFDTLGIGSFATTTAMFKLRGRIDDDRIPGTLNVGHALPTVAQALIFIAVVEVDLATLLGMIAAAVLGAWLGVRVVARLPRRAIQIGMGVALLVAAGLFLAANLNWLPGGGGALGLRGGTLAFAIAVNLLLGALMMLGIGLYAPCLILVSLLGMNPIAAFPVMMGACAFLMPVGGGAFVRSGRYDLRAALGLAVGGIPGVLVAAFIVKSLPLEWLRWLVVAVVLVAAAQMLMSARRAPRA
ncbi:sulfite exporter TauE/SafE family protein [Lysobacter silvisoli]|uniref:Probable membrane transporter protein n=1 Tax=Lysobacter silvisoli TaxID=2293254 RepID=A0A371JXY6_9GAMM|nr:sulfite exporter TauE/SafE family protein [Lysobacter silvisoli]RDZ26525.1 sulfite exporter TauE/SafE family protein [Lysobacter silvisoli]